MLIGVRCTDGALRWQSVIRVNLSRSPMHFIVLTGYRFATLTARRRGVTSSVIRRLVRMGYHKRRLRIRGCPP